MKPSNWDEVETAYLVYCSMQSGRIDYERISNKLVSYGKSKGRDVSGTYRNVNGITIQSNYVKQYLNGDHNANISTTYKKVCDYYLNNDEKYYELLEKAKEQIDSSIVIVNTINKTKKNIKKKKSSSDLEKIGLSLPTIKFLEKNKIKTLRKFISSFEKGSLLELNGVGSKKRVIFDEAYNNSNAYKKKKVSLGDKYDITILSKSVESLNVNKNVINALISNEVFLFEDLLAMPISKLYMFKGLGQKTIKSIKKEIKLLNKYKNMYFIMFQKNSKNKKMSAKELLEMQRKEKENEIFEKGSIIYALKKEYFKPKDMEEFEKEAEVRKLTKEQFCLHITDNQYTLIKDGLINDDKILEYFENHMTDAGKVYISQTKENEKMINYADANGYTISELVNLYGYSYTDTNEAEESINKKHKEILERHIIKDNTVFVETYSDDFNILNSYAKNNNMTITEYINSLGYVRLNTIIDTDKDEEDMEAYDQKTYYECDRIMAKYPLIGSHIYKASDFEEMEREAKDALDLKMAYPNHKLSSVEKSEITLVTIEYAKKWDSRKSKNFWNNIILQFGYKEEQNKVRKIISDCVYDSLKEANRFFFADSFGNRYKSTILIHAMSTSKSWNNLCEMLFEFFVHNLNYTCLDEDPRINILVDVLKDKFNKYELIETNEDEVDDEAIVIANKSYSLQEGIRKLIICKPRFTIRLFSKMIRYMSNYLHNEKAVSCYEEDLCRKYLDRYIDKLSKKKNKELNELLEKRHRVYAGVTTDFSKINPIYRYDHEKVSLLLPDVVVPRNIDFSKTTLQLFEDRKLINEYNLKYFGNKELGYTIQGLELDIEDEFAFRDNIRKYEVRVKLYIDDKCVYDSEESLFKDYFFFDRTYKEVNNLSSNETYFVVIGEESIISVDGLGSNIKKLANYKKTDEYLLELSEQYTIAINKKIVAMDAESKNQKARLIMPDVKEDAVFTKGQDKYRICPSNGKFKLFIDEKEDLIQYIIKINGETIYSKDLLRVLSDVNNTYELPVKKYLQDNNVLTIKVANTKTQEMLVDEKIRICDNIEYNFDKMYYYSQDDFEKGRFYFSDGGLKLSYRLSQNSDVLPIDYQDGKLEFYIPKITVVDNNNELWNYTKKLWYKDVPSDLTLYVNGSINAGSDISIKLGNASLVKQGKFYYAGEAISMLSKSENKQELLLDINGSSFVLAYLYTMEHFHSDVEFDYTDGELYWNQGNGYVGSRDDVVYMKVSQNGNTIINILELDVNDNKIDLKGNTLEDGEYDFEIYLKSDNPFIAKDTLLCDGEFSYGNIDLVRFENVTLDIVKITKVKQKGKDIITEKVSTLSMYIDNIVYKGEVEEFNNISSDIYPIYEGELYLIDKNCHYEKFNTILSDNSTTDKVRITFINNGIIEITTIEGDAYYLSKNEICIDDKSRPIKEYYITNEEEQNTGDLYFYEIRKEESDV